MHWAVHTRHWTPELSRPRPRQDSDGQTASPLISLNIEQQGRCPGKSCPCERTSSRRLERRYYSWSPDSFDTDLEFVPMLWGQRQVDDWQNTINQTVQQSKPTAVLGMNELRIVSLHLTQRTANFLHPQTARNRPVKPDSRRRCCDVADVHRAAQGPRFASRFASSVWSAVG